MTAQTKPSYALSPVIEWIFAPEHPNFVDRVHAAKAAGFSNVEFHFWRNKPLADVRRALDETGITLNGILVEPWSCLISADQRRGEFLQALTNTLAAAKQLGSKAVVMPSGMTDAGVDRRVQHDAMVASLKLGAQLAADAGVLMLLEPVNTKVDHPGIFLDTTTEGLDVVEAVGHPSVRLLYDIYHSHAMGEDPATVHGQRMHLVGHVQAADFPGRHQPGTGSIPWSRMLELLWNRGYRGPIGLEYRPEGSSLDSLAATKRVLGG